LKGLPGVRERTDSFSTINWFLFYYGAGMRADMALPDSCHKARREAFPAGLPDATIR